MSTRPLLPGTPSILVCAPLETVGQAESGTQDHEADDDRHNGSKSPAGSDAMTETMLFNLAEPDARGGVIRTRTLAVEKAELTLM